MSMILVKALGQRLLLSNHIQCALFSFSPISPINLKIFELANLQEIIVLEQLTCDLTLRWPCLATLQYPSTLVIIIAW
jgi:hypothetical protein